MDYDNTSTETQDDELQKSYIIEQFENILEKIGEGYGEPLQNELIRRMEKTIEEFNNEITSAFDQLKSREDERQKMYDMIKEGSIIENKNDKDAEDSSNLSDSKTGKSNLLQTLDLGPVYLAILLYSPLFWRPTAIMRNRSSI